jgi:hypothetical protein
VREREPTVVRFEGIDISAPALRNEQVGLRADDAGDRGDDERIRVRRAADRCERRRLGGVDGARGLDR